MLQGITKTNLAHLLGPIFGLVFLFSWDKKRNGSFKFLLKIKQAPSLLEIEKLTYLTEGTRKHETPS